MHIATERAIRKNKSQKQLKQLSVQAYNASSRNRPNNLKREKWVDQKGRARYIWSTLFNNVNNRGKQAYISELSTSSPAMQTKQNSKT